MNAPDQFAPLYSDEQIAEARDVKFSKVLDHLGASHKLDPEYRGRNKSTVRILVAYKNRNYRFVVNGPKWIDELPNGDLSAKSGHGAIDFASYVTSMPFPKAVGVCLAAMNISVEPAGVTVAAPVQLEFPYWPVESRGSPNEFLRCALFNARNRNAPRVSWNAKAPLKLAILGGGTISYVGEELRQLDEKVWLQLIHLARKFPAGHPVEFVAKHFCEAIKWPLCKDSYNQLRVCLTRMQATSLTVESARLRTGIKVSLVGECLYKDASNPSLRRWWVKVHPCLVELFGGDHFSYIEWQQRLALPDGIATWLHGFFSTHRWRKPVAIDDLALGAGLQSENPENIKRSIRRALKALKDEGCIEGYQFKKTHVLVARARPVRGGDDGHLRNESGGN